MGFFGFGKKNKEKEQEKMKTGLEKTRTGFWGNILNTLTGSVIDDEMYDDLEEQLILADVGGEVAVRLVDKLRDRVREKGLKTGEEAADALRDIIAEEMTPEAEMNLSGKVHFRLRRHLLGNDVPQGICRFFAGLQALLAHPVPQLVHQTHGHFAAHIRKDELLFQIIVHFIVDDAAGEGVEDIAPETGAGLFQTRFHFFLFFFFVFLAKSEEPHSVLLSFSLIYIRKPAWRQPVPDPV